MPKINVLEKHIAELIAAGEVVERPSSVIKELVENSIDAGATAVTVEIKNGGIAFMRVTDNGCGIDRGDVATAFLRHATSKITHKEDLVAINTLGFRGEALASICAVAKVEMLTCTAGSIAGTRYRIEGGDEISCEDAGCPQGTTIVVRDLFYNTPARMKFLKKDVSEGIAVSGVMDKIALSHPEISIRFIREGKEVLHTPGDGKLRSAVFSVYGRQFVEGMLPVAYELNSVTVNGFTGKPSEARPSRNLQNFFINGRFVKTRTAMAALEEAYKGSLMVGKFPVCVLHIDISSDTIDVNVHPAKIEVRFANERPIFDAVYHAVKSALLQHDKADGLSEKERKHIDISPSKHESIEQISFQNVKSSRNTRKDLPLFSKGKFLNTEDAISESSEKRHMEKIIPMPNNKPSVSSPLPEQKEEEVQEIAPIDRTISRSILKDSSSFTYRTISPREEIEEITENVVENIPPAVEKISQPAPATTEGEEAPACDEEASADTSTGLILVGELFQTYLLLQTTKELVLVDKHAAHERLLYEKLKSEGHEAYQQYLLEPITLTLDKAEYAIALEKTDVLQQAGFETEDFGLGTLLIRSAPLYLEHQEITSAVVEILGYLMNNKRDITTQQLDWIYHNIACRAAIKAGDHSDRLEMMALIQQLYDNPSVRYCPHGRPVFVTLTKYEIEKKFGRA